MRDYIIVLSVNPYSVANEGTGVINEGLSMQYIMSKNLEPCKDLKSRFLGYRVLKGSVPKSNLSECTSIPGVFECEFDVKPDASGKAMLKPSSITFVSALALQGKS